jgi:enterochelin esterase-like enzyme
MLNIKILIISDSKMNKVLSAVYGLKDRKVIIFLLCLLGSSFQINAQSQEHISVFIVDSMFSESLNEYRLYSLYLPANFDTTISYQTIVATDGQIIQEGNYKTILDSLIANKYIPPVILLSPFANEKPYSGNLEYRNYEYLENLGDRTLYHNHLIFFTKEFINFIKDKYHIKIDTAMTMFYGASNGGDFGLSLFVTGYRWFNKYLCFSPVGFSNRFYKANLKPNNNQLFLTYGTEEEHDNHFKNLMKFLKKYNYSFECKPYKGGHKRYFWEQMFTEFLVEINKN